MNDQPENLTRLNEVKPMKFMIPFLVAALPVAAFAQSQPGQAPGASGVTLPKTTEVMVILTPKQAVTRQQIMAVMPSEIRETVRLYLDGDRKTHV